MKHVMDQVRRKFRAELAETKRRRTWRYKALNFVSSCNRIYCSIWKPPDSGNSRVSLKNKSRGKNHGDGK